MQNLKPNGISPRPDGYWNGKVWVPHQWFLWRALVGRGDLDLAWTIARTALDLWSRNTDETYCCWEQFDGISGQGEGAHHFAGLSAPIAALYQTYTCTGRVTCGWDVWQEASRWHDDHLSVRLSAPFRPGPGGIIVGTGRPGRSSLQWGDELPRQVSTEHHHLDLVLPLAREPVALRLSPC
jgi:hypothetical protein